jgi:hypothetical protein
MEMEMLPSYAEAHAIYARSLSVQERLELQPQEISSLLTLRLQSSGEEVELIEMRYRQFLALMELEALFAEGQLGCM